MDLTFLRSWPSNLTHYKEEEKIGKLIMSIDIDNVFIKSEPQDDILNSSDIFQNDISQNITETVNPVKVEIKSEIDKLTKSYDNEENHENSTSVLCKNVSDNFFTSIEMNSEQNKVNKEEFSDEDNNENALKMELINHNENTWDTSDIIKQEDVDLAVKVKVSQSQNFTELVYPVKVEVKSDNEELWKNTRRVCKNEPKDGVYSDKTDSGCFKVDIEDIFNEDDIVDISKLKEILNYNENCKDNIKQEVDHGVNIESSELHSEVVNTVKSEAKLDIKDLTKSSNNEQIPKNTTSIVCKNNSPCSKTHVRFSIEPNKVHPLTSKGPLMIFFLLRPDDNSSPNKSKSKIFPCQFCDKTFVKKYSLNNHILRQHQKEIKSDIKDFIPNKIHSCKLCSYQSISKTKLESHIDSMHNEYRVKKFPCQFCDKSFVIKQWLENHMLKEHLKEIKNNIKEFISHKIYTCKVCDFQTTYKERLDAHISSSHKPQTSKKFSCNFCDKSFVLKQSLDNHQLKQHKDKIKDKMEDFITSKIYICKFCSYKTTSNSNFRSHVNSVHNK